MPQASAGAGGGSIAWVSSWFSFPGHVADFSIGCCRCCSCRALPFGSCWSPSSSGDFTDAGRWASPGSRPGARVQSAARVAVGLTRPGSSGFRDTTCSQRTCRRIRVSFVFFECCGSPRSRSLVPLCWPGLLARPSQAGSQSSSTRRWGPLCPPWCSSRLPAAAVPSASALLPSRQDSEPWLLGLLGGCRLASVLSPTAFKSGR